MLHSRLIVMTRNHLLMKKNSHPEWEVVITVKWKHMTTPKLKMMHTFQNISHQSEKRNIWLTKRKNEIGLIKEALLFVTDSLKVFFFWKCKQFTFPELLRQICQPLCYSLYVNIHYIFALCNYSSHKWILYAANYCMFMTDSLTSAMKKLPALKCIHLHWKRSKMFADYSHETSFSYVTTLSFSAEQWLRCHLY